MVTIATATRNAQTNATVDLLDAGTGNPTIVLGTAGMATTLITFSLDGTAAFGASSNGAATATGLPISATAAASGTVAAYEVRDRDDTVVWSGTSVTTTGGGGEIEVSDTSIVSSNDYNLTSCSYTSPAS